MRACKYIYMWKCTFVSGAFFTLSFPSFSCVDCCRVKNMQKRHGTFVRIKYQNNSFLYVRIVSFDKYKFYCEIFNTNLIAD